MRACVANTRAYMRPSGRFSTCFVVSARSRVCVCVYRHVVTYSENFVLRCSHGAIFCNFLNVLRRLCPITCVYLCLSTPAWLHLLDISIFAIATHSFSHICTLSNTHFCSCFRCHFSRHATQKRVPIGRVSSAATKIALLRATATPQETAARLAYQMNRATASRATESPQETEADN